MQSLFDLRTRIQAEEARRGWHEAMSRLQAKMPRVTKNGEILSANGSVRSKYAKLEDIDAACRPLYTAEGFSVRYTTELKDRILYVTCHVSREGHNTQQDSYMFEIIAEILLGRPLEQKPLTAAMEWGKERDAPRVRMQPAFLAFPLCESLNRIACR